MPSIRRVVPRPALLGECPIWSVGEQVLYWLDIDGRLVHRYDPTTDIDESKSVPGRPGSLVLTDTAGKLLLAIEHQLIWFDWPSGETSPFVDLDVAAPDRLNDGRTDPAGRFVVGSIQADRSEAPTQQVYQVSGDGSVGVLRGGVAVTNGIAFDPSRGRMYFADTMTETVVVYDYDPDSGSCENERLFVDYADLPGKPDGGCVDAEGCYWSASVYGWAITRFTPDGDVERRVEVPVEKPTMPAFGGPDLRTLFVTSIGDAGDTKAAPVRDGIEPGSLLAIDVDVAGVVDTPFAGSPPN
jgi:sugar lactone lactonase YvrE